MVVKALKDVYSNYRYIILSVVVILVVFSLSVWIPNIRALIGVWSIDTATIFEKITFSFTLFSSIKTNFTAISASYTIAIALLFGINVSMLTYYIRLMKSDSIKGVSALGLGGLVSGIFGIGCAACGTFILGSLLGLFGAASILAFLPFGGEEFGFLGVGLLIYSIYVISKRINQPKVC